MAVATFTLTIGDLSHHAALELAEQVENSFQMDALAVTINETHEARSIWETVLWFEDEQACLAAQENLQVSQGTIAPVPDEDWVRRSLQGLSPVIAGRFFLYGSHDRQLRRSGGHPLEIDAGTAFGTGHHGTTAGCLVALDEILKRNRPQRILDLGCGTGVLAIAAVTALKQKALATDIDNEAVRVTALNARLNGVMPSIVARTAAGLHNPVFRERGPFDLIFANILARPLASLAGSLSEILAPGGHLILSGLTVDQLRWIRACYCNRGLVPTRCIRMENWIALVLTRPTKKRPRTKVPGRSSARSCGPGWEDA